MISSTKGVSALYFILSAPNIFHAPFVWIILYLLQTFGYSQNPYQTFAAKKYFRSDFGHKWLSK